MSQDLVEFLRAGGSLSENAIFDDDAEELNLGQQSQLRAKNATANVSGHFQKPLTRAKVVDDEYGNGRRLSPTKSPAKPVMRAHDADLDEEVRKLEFTILDGHCVQGLQKVVVRILKKWLWEFSESDCQEILKVVLVNSNTTQAMFCETLCSCLHAWRSDTYSHWFWSIVNYLRAANWKSCNGKTKHKAP